MSFVPQIGEVGSTDIVWRLGRVRFNFPHHLPVDTSLVGDLVSGYLLVLASAPTLLIKRTPSPSDPRCGAILSTNQYIPLDIIIHKGKHRWLTNHCLSLHHVIDVLCRVTRSATHATSCSINTSLLCVTLGPASYGWSRPTRVKVK